MGRLARRTVRGYRICMIAEKDAVAKLLSEGDADTVRLVKEQLMLGGEENLRDLQDLACWQDEQVSRHARDVLAAILHNEAEDDFDLLCRFFCDSCDVEPALWQVGPALEPGLDLKPGLQKVEQWGRQFAVRISDAISSRERVLALGSFMAGELCFRGNTSDYYHHRNSLLPCVIESRMGLPITLTMLYRAVAVRAGMIVDGLNLPGHFVARHEDVFFDPFHKGRILTRADLESVLQRQGLRLKPTHLLPAPPRQILARTLANLLYAFDIEEDADRRGRVQAWLSALCKGA